MKIFNPLCRISDISGHQIYKNQEFMSANIRNNAGNHKSHS